MITNITNTDTISLVRMADGIISLTIMTEYEIARLSLDQKSLRKLIEVLSAYE